ncbi:MAG: nucleotide exchange factor GrpE [Armatimonadota bacterium]|nr:nucleotide exchange factor GrpE [Armatimonadota bacterium]
MSSKRKIPINNNSAENSSESMAQQQRDKELEETNAVPPEVFSESPEEADIVTESTAEEVLPDDIRILKERCEQAEKRAEEEHDNFLRTLADFTNFRRRAREELEQVRKFATEDFIIRLLPILDNFERAIKAAEETKNFDSLHGGVILILRQLRELLAKEGVEPIKAVGEKFDPMKHEAVARIDTTEYPDETIIEEVRTGYTMNGRVIRPSAVKVAHHPVSDEQN